MRIANCAVSLSSAAHRYHFLSPGKPLQTPAKSLRTKAGRGVASPVPMSEMENGYAAATIAAAADDDAEFGFKRSEMYKKNLAGTVDPYDRHLFLCFKSPDSWEPRVEASDADPLPKLLASAIKARKSDITVKTKVTISEGREGTEFEDGDVLIFPDMVKYRGLKEDLDIDAFVDDVLVNGKPWASGVREVLSGSYIFVCAHASRDKRCGVCGPVLIEKLNEGIEARGLKDQVFVSACSHVGGHKYAGNVIVFNPDSEGKVVGSWYGYVTPDDVPEILDKHIGKGVVIERILRGQMGTSIKESNNVDEQNLPNGDAKESKKREESNSEVNKENATGCCQGANGVSCCRDGSFGEGEEKKVKEDMKAHGKKGLGKLSSWIGSVDQSEILAAAAVVGAVATVAVAYSFYRRSG